MEVLSAAHRASGGGGLVLFGLILLVVAIVAAAKILPKVGYSAWYALLLLIPVVSFVMILVFAFSDWPVDKELRRYRQGGYGPGPGGYPAPSWPAQPPPGYGPGGPQFPPSGWPPAPGGSPPPWPGGSGQSAPGGSPPPWPGS
ncbi:MAG: hypothetical protein ACLQCU_12185 [Acidimicrobiales bacterium]|jgi:hypothetical protein